MAEINDLTASVSLAVDEMPWLTPADGAAIDLAKTYAAAIDEALDAGNQEQITKALYLGPHLLRTLESLGGTPAGRRTMKETKEGPGGKLRQLRAVQADRTA